MPPSRRSVAQAVSWLFGACALSAAAQTPPDGTPNPAPIPAPAPANPAPPPPAATPSAATPPAPARPLLPRVQIQGGRPSDIEERRQSTASKIVIGREEIDRFGDSTLGEVLRRLPGVSVPGPAGRGGAPRMRGLGGGYTQLLIDGQRAPIGFSIEQLTPDQVERIEIIRAPTAETGARAIGGTLNIITREGFRVRLNDLRLGLETQRGRVSPGISWTWNQPLDDLIANVSASVFRREQLFSSSTVTVDEDLATGTAVRQKIETSRNEEVRTGMNLTSRLQWRREGGNLLLLNPSLFHIQGRNDRVATLEQPFGTPAPTFATAVSDRYNRFTNARINGQWRQRFDDGLRAELSGGGGSWTARFGEVRDEFDPAGTRLLTRKDDSRIDEQTLNLTGKLSKLIDGNHSVVVGSEVEASRRSEERANLQDGSAIADDFGDNLRASSQRVALYAQNEWEITPQWSAYAGLRWEGIATRGTGADGEQPSNRSSVTTPLLHGLWKLSPDSRDQVRISLTRSYRSPTLQNLVARRNPALGENGPTNADRAGNAALRPELATGVDVGIERYIADGGVLSVNLFHRRLRDTIRTVVALETVDGIGPRYVARPRNIGGATTQGIELEAKFRLDQLITDGPRTEMRTNLSLYRSSIDQIPGPDNRLSGQPPGSLNVGADHRFRGTPLSAGATLGWTPGYATRVSQAEFGEIGARRQWDAYALWRFSPVMQLRLSASNLAPRDDVTLNSIESLALREVSRTVQDTSTNWQARLEFKL